MMLEGSGSGSDDSGTSNGGERSGGAILIRIWHQRRVTFPSVVEEA